MYGNGAVTGMTEIIILFLQKIILKVPHPVEPKSFAVAAGKVLRAVYGLRIGAETIHPCSEPTHLDFAVFKTIKRFLIF